MKYIIKNFLLKYWVFIVLVCIFQVAQTFLTLYLPNMNANIIDNGVVKGDIDYVWSEGGAMVIVALIQVICSMVASFFGTLVAFKLARRVRASLFKKTQDFSFREISLFGAPTLITRNTNDVQQVQQFIMFLLTLIISSPIMLIGGIVMALQQDATMSIIIACTIPCICVVLAFFVKYTMPYFRRYQKITDKINSIIREQVTGIRVVRAFVREKSEQKRFSKTNDKMLNLNVKTGRAMSILIPVFMFITNLSVVAVMWFGGVRVDSGEMQIGSITAFITYMMYVNMAILMSAMVFVMYPRAAISAKRISKVLTTESTVIETDAPETVPDPKGVLEFNNVSFQYAGANDKVIHNISFKAEPGKTTAIIGSTGAGKSTILRLIPRLADPTEGSVTFDGVNIEKLPFKFLSDNIAIIPQKSFLFTGTVADNMRFGKEDATDEEIYEALKVAQSYDFVIEKAKEEGLDNPLELNVAQGGTNFSGGQRQRLAIARALIKKALVYQFDDSFSALDYITDHNLRQELKPWTVNSTVIIVAQRISTIRRADQILVLDEGIIVGRGTHDELLDNCQTYQEIVDSQLTLEEARQ